MEGGSAKGASAQISTSIAKTRQSDDMCIVDCASGGGATSERRDGQRGKSARGVGFSTL